MKNSELIKQLSEFDPGAEVGYEFQAIARAHRDISGKYVDLSGERIIDKNLIDDTGVFVLVSQYEKVTTKDTEHPEVCTEINGVFSKKESAEKMGKFLIKCSNDMKKEGKWEWVTDDCKESYGIRYINYRIKNFLIL